MVVAELVAAAELAAAAGLAVAAAVVAAAAFRLCLQDPRGLVPGPQALASHQA